MLRQILRRTLSLSALFGIDILRFLHSISNLSIFLKDAYVYQKLCTNSQFSIQSRYVYPLLTDFKEQAGNAGGHYFFQDLWAARKIFAAKPARHIDIGSRIDGFIAHLLTFMPVEVIDIRPLRSDVTGLDFIQDDATSLLRYENNSLESISSLHAVEHFGLGRYGDPIDPDGCFKVMNALQRVLKPGGRLYFSVPIGIERVEFNAHRVFAPQTILNTFHDLELLSFVAVDDAGQFHATTNPEDFAQARFACGLFEFTKT